MKKKNTILLLIILILLFTPIIGLAEGAYDVDYFLGIKDIIENNYYAEVSEKELIEGAIQGLFYNLDPHSNYYTKEEFEALMVDVSGDFVGIGVYIKEEDNSIIIISPIEGSPAYKAGIVPGDEIISVDNKKVKGMNLEEVSNLIKGKLNTKVRLGIKRNNKILHYNITREEIKLNPVESKILEDKIGYIKIKQFNQNTYENVVKALKELDKKNIQNIIIDLRDNPGGFLDEVIDVSKLFIPEGPIVHIKYKGNRIRTYYSNLQNPKYNLVVLVNENSASASEILAAAVKDRKAGIIIGTSTYGKGTVQQLLYLPNGDGMKLTIAEYLSPNKTKINGKGISPDIIAKNTGDKDLQLQKAIKVLRP